MPTITRFEEIEAWQTARELTKMIYSITDVGKISRDFGLKDQLRKASVSVVSNISVSVVSNIAEGFESKTQPALTETQFSELFSLTEKASRQLSRFISYLEANSLSQRIKEDSPEYEV